MVKPADVLTCDDQHSVPRDLTGQPRDVDPLGYPELLLELPDAAGRLTLLLDLPPSQHGQLVTCDKSIVTMEASGWSRPLTLNTDVNILRSELMKIYLESENECWHVVIRGNTR